MHSLNFIDLGNCQFGRLTVIEEKGKTPSGNVLWKCQCDCGNTTIVPGSKLMNGHTKSCGCLRKSSNAMGYSHTRLYHIWIGMKNRCMRPNNDNYRWYGGRNIGVCAEWMDFQSFREWAIANGYKDNLQLDRINPNGDYSPQNCRWVTTKAQANNRTSNRYVFYKNRRMTVAEFSELVGVQYKRVLMMLNRGESPEKIAMEGLK